MLNRDSAFNGYKRLRSRFAICGNCNQEFDVTDNGEENYVWHDGMLAQSHYRGLICTRGRICVRADSEQK